MQTSPRFFLVWTNIKNTRSVNRKSNWSFHVIRMTFRLHVYIERILILLFDLFMHQDQQPQYKLSINANLPVTALPCKTMLRLSCVHKLTYTANTHDSWFDTLSLYSIVYFSASLLLTLSIAQLTKQWSKGQRAHFRFKTQWRRFFSFQCLNHFFGRMK